MRRTGAAVAAALALLHGTALARGGAGAGADGGEAADPELPWHLDALDAPEAWSAATGQGVRVGVIGTDFSRHAALAANLASVERLPSRSVGGEGDHGAAVAGLLAARGGTGGPPGVAPRAELHVCQVDGTLPRLLHCLDHLLRDVGVRVVSYSRGMELLRDVDPEDPPDDLEDTMERWAEAIERELAPVSRQDWLLVTATGNQGLSDASLTTPLLHLDDPDLRRRMLVVGAVDPEGRVASYTNRGGDLLAPGGDARRPLRVLTGRHETTGRHGTSFAAPLVAGVAALVWDLRPGWGPGAVRRVLRRGRSDTIRGTPVLGAAGAVEAARPAGAGSEASSEPGDDADGAKATSR